MTWLLTEDGSIIDAVCNTFAPTVVLDGVTYHRHAAHLPGRLRIVFLQEGLSWDFRARFRVGQLPGPKKPVKAPREPFRSPDPGSPSPALPAYLSLAA